MRAIRLVPGVTAMRHDEQLFNEWDETTSEQYPMDRRTKFDLWLTCYAPGHNFWLKVSLWWHYNVRRYPKPPPIDQDPVAIRLGLVPPATDGAEGGEK